MLVARKAAATDLDRSSGRVLSSVAQPDGARERQGGDSEILIGLNDEMNDL